MGMRANSKPGKYKPHQGKREKGRRLRQLDWNVLSIHGIVDWNRKYKRNNDD